MPLAQPAPQAPRPIHVAQSTWLRWNPQGDFAALLVGYLKHGFVYSGDDAFILAMPQGDAWFVHLAAGDLRRFTQLAPYPLPNVRWQRRGTGPARTYGWDRFCRHTTH